MLKYENYKLANGLKLLVHQEEKSDIAAVNLMYNVGSRDEHPDMTGLAHLFEHLMFEGSANVLAFDRELEMAGGENNAFTNKDITNYYITLPSVNLETALWLEADRMEVLSLSQEKLDIQKSVVIEEFKERYLNQPYGDLWSIATDLSYKTHPYQWSTIGREIEHIKKVKRNDVLDFYSRFYAPNNVVLAVASPLKPGEVYDMVNKWFGDIPPASLPYKRDLPAEPIQTEPRFKEVIRSVPSSMIVRTYHMADRLSERYYIHDLISDVLADGDSSRLKNQLVKNEELFSQIDAYISGDIEPGLFVIAGKVHDNVNISEANTAIDKELEKISSEKITATELNKAKNKALLRLEEEKSGVLEKAMNLSYFELLGNAALFEQQNEYYKNITAENFFKECQTLFAENKQNILFYRAK
ncbi:MAG: insulinase family protein [Bacteroidales bacterium]|nr:insulinase family protein [Bacteroidales bacterium]